MPRYRVHLMTPSCSVDVEAQNEVGAEQAALADAEFDWAYDVLFEHAEYPWHVTVEELPEDPEQN